MNKKIIGLTMLVLFLTLSLALTGCGTAPAAGSQNSGPQLRITITGISSEFNGKLGWIQLDTGSSRNDPTVAWAMGNIGNGSTTFNVLDWNTDKPYSKTGDYFVTFFIWEDLDAAGARGVEALWQGIIMSKNIGEITSIELSEFTKL